MRGIAVLNGNGSNAGATKPSDLAKLAQARDTLLLAIAQQYDQQAIQRSKRR